VLRDLVACRTAALGGHVERCNHCGHQRIAYNSCRNRHCPKCQAGARAKWLDQRAAELLPVPYFHVVFTLPNQLGPLALQNRAVVYGILFQAAAATLLEVAADPKHLGAEIGVLAVLHTWGQNLMHHPHLHCVVTGGGLSPDGLQWVGSREKFFLPVRVLGRVFRGKFLHLLREALRKGSLAFSGELTALQTPRQFERLLDASVVKDWVVYAKPPFGGPEQVLKYLARYTHRVAISNRRLMRMDDGKVSFRWKDYAEGSTEKTMTLDAGEFIRRFLLHVLPSGFVKIRHYGFLSNRLRREKLAVARRLLGVKEEPSPSPVAAEDSLAVDDASATAVDAVRTCPVCGQGAMVVVERLPKSLPIVRDSIAAGHNRPATRPAIQNSS
jgi:hypothetical protein